MSDGMMWERRSELDETGFSRLSYGLGVVEAKGITVTESTWYEKRG
jgi:hypothetical protein